jgi:hypothetical protein
MFEFLNVFFSFQLILKMPMIVVAIVKHDVAMGANDFLEIFVAFFNVHLHPTIVTEFFVANWTENHDVCSEPINVSQSTEQLMSNLPAGKMEKLPVQKPKQNKPKNFICRHCLKAFAAKSSVKNHIKNFHNSEELTRCLYCSDVARSKFEMAKHLEAKHFSENVEAENKI